MQPTLEHLLMDRRQLLSRCGMGMGTLGLSSLLSSQGLLNAEEKNKRNSLNPLDVRPAHFAAKAKHIIHIFANGGPSHVDTFDPKPKLTEYHGKMLPRPNLGTERKTGSAWKSPFEFKRYGKSGIEVSDLFPHVGSCVDDLCIVRSMYADIPNHEPSLLLMNCGEARLIRPSFGSWITYGLGSENQNLPGFVVMCPGGYPIQESQNWQAGFLPGIYQGAYLDTKHDKVEKLIENIKNAGLSMQQQRQQLDLVQALNTQHQQQRKDDPQLESRIQSFELAYRMQMQASDVFDLSKEPPHILDMYGKGVHARQLLYARRMIERGVRFVQVWHGDGQPWDNHDDLEVNHKRLAQQCDQPIAALLKDLKQRGLLDETLVIWGGEFGRTPVVELPTAGANAGKVNGRDHNHWGFSMWLAGGGVKAGTVVGATDEFGFQSVENKVHVHDLHATLLHLLGFDHERFTYRYAGRDFRLTDVHGKVVKDIIA
jgi:hypothetical protein